MSLRASEGGRILWLVSPGPCDYLILSKRQERLVEGNKVGLWPIPQTSVVNNDTLWILTDRCIALHPNFRLQSKFLTNRTCSSFIAKKIIQTNVWGTQTPKFDRFLASHRSVTRRQDNYEPLSDVLLNWNQQIFLQDCNRKWKKKEGQSAFDMVLCSGHWCWLS